jgi:hypothetical protein
MHSRVLKRSSVLLRAIVVVVAAVALVVSLGMAGASRAAASSSMATDATSAGDVPARAAVTCSEGRVPAGFYNQDVFGEPNECAQCQWAGVSWELKGGYTAFCKHFPDATYPTAWLYIRCDKCREATPAADSAPLRVNHG